MQNIKIGIICIYMGELPKSFKFWLESCKNNVEIDWILITDQKIENLKSIKNIRIINSSLESLKSRFEKKLQMSISLQKAYKLCDYRPSYGLFFEEELKEYNYWGYCDMDMVFGKILKILPKDLILNYDKLLKYGHLTLYKNNIFINNLFKEKAKKTLSYKSVYTTNISCAFDESEKGIVKIFRDHNIKTFCSKNFIDICPQKYNFLEKEDRINVCYTYEDGSIYKNIYINEELKKYEKIYIHFQKRKLNFDEVDIEKNKKYIFGEKIIKFQEQKDIIDYILSQRNNSYKNFKVKLKFLMKTVKKSIDFKLFYLREKQ